MKITVIMPALNEEKAISAVLDLVPEKELNKMGYEVEKLVVDNGSVDNTAYIAKKKGAVVVNEPRRGYGNAYKKGFASATGDIIVTGDADMTYPFDELPKLISIFEREKIDFMNTDRLSTLKKGVMAKTNIFGNLVLSVVTKLLFKWPFKDSQSGMWIFKKSILSTLNLNSSGMAFSQEIKIDAFVAGYRCTEIPVTYRARIGKVKLSTFKDGFYNLFHLFKKSFEILNINTVLMKRVITEAHKKI